MYISCDPGVAFCGLAVIDPSTHCKVVEHHLVKNTRKFTDEEKAMESVYGARTVKVFAILNKLTELIEKYPVTLIVVEAPFYNALTPLAYGSLLEVIVAIKYRLVIEHKLQFKMIEPLLVKKLFASKGMANKEAMRHFLTMKKNDKHVDLQSEIETLSEHEIDAIAVGFVYYLSLTQPPQG